MRPRAFSPSSSLTSRPTTSKPACTQTCAIPEPIVPRPTTPTREISTARDPTLLRSARAQRTDDADRRPADLRAVLGAWGALPAGGDPRPRRIHTPPPAG